MNTKTPPQRHAIQGPEGQEDMPYLLTPGPLTTSRTVKLAMLADWGSRDVEFRKIVGNIRKKFGLDNLDVNTDANGLATVTLGKYLTEKVYTEVEVQQGNTAISLNLDIAPHITLKAQVDSDGQTGIGIFLQRDYLSGLRSI